MSRAIHCLVPFAALLPSAALAQSKPATPPTITVRVDPRVELLSVIFRLAGNPEYGQGRVLGYAKAVDAHFGAFRDHPAVELARTLRRNRSVSYDAVMSMAVHVTDTATVAEAVPFESRPQGLDRRWGTTGAREFLEQTRDFVEKAKFAEFFEQHQELYTTAEDRIRAVIAKHAQLEWFDRFFGHRPGVKFVLALGLLNGGANYGARLVHPDGHEDLYCVLGVWMTDEKGEPTFDATVLSTVVHEFCHSYCNPLVDVHADELEDAAREMWPHVADAMKSQAYGNWQTMMRESLVRACVVRYVAAAGGEKARDEEIDRQKQRQFLWTDELSELLAEYEADRDTFANLDAFMPRIAAFFDDYAGRLEAILAMAPVIVSIVPANGATDVDPATKAIVITFDRPMKPSYSFVGGGDHYPKTSVPSFDAERVTISLPVELRPDWRYVMWLNRGRFNSFRGADGTPLRPVRYSFKTRGQMPR